MGDTMSLRVIQTDKIPLKNSWTISLQQRNSIQNVNIIRGWLIECLRVSTHRSYLEFQ